MPNVYNTIYIKDEDCVCYVQRVYLESSTRMLDPVADSAAQIWPISLALTPRGGSPTTHTALIAPLALYTLQNTWVLCLLFLK
jgi:hypothetical protein